MIEKPSLLVKRREKREREKNCVIKITHTHTLVGILKMN